jgi:hypothetical protein
VGVLDYDFKGLNINIQSRLLLNLNKSCGIQLRQSWFFFKAMKSAVIRLRFVKTYKMSLGIKKFIDFSGFLYVMDFVRFFS